MEFLFGFFFHDVLEIRVGQILGRIVVTTMIAGIFALLFGIPCLYLFDGGVARYVAAVTFCGAIILIYLAMRAFRVQSGG